jgi:4-amino-4-deoxy-L-arabinose transferase-like glycosyltransferase
LNRSLALERLVLAAVPLLTIWGIWSFGIWDPSELSAADAALALGEPDPVSPEHSPLSARLIAASFDVFGVREWAGRLPGVLSACITAALTLALLWRAPSRRSAAIAAVALASTPLFLLNARLMMGDAIGVFAQTTVAVGAFAVSAPGASSRSVFGVYLALALSILLSTSASGILLGPLPPLLAVAFANLLAEDDGRASRLARWLLPTTAVVLALGVARAISSDDPVYSPWLGGGAVGGNPPDFDAALELLFHGFAPWSAALPVAAVWALAPRSGRDERTQRLAWALCLWTAFAFVSWSIFASRYGTPPYLALVPLAGLIGIWLTEVCDTPIARWPAAVVVALSFALLIRDYALYPSSPLRALAVDGLRAPDMYRPGAAWAAVLGLTGALLCLTLVSHEQIARPDAARTLRWFRSRWDLGPVARAWLAIGALLLAGCFLFGAACLVLDVPLPSLALRIGRASFLVPFVVAALVFGLPWLRYGYGRAGVDRVFPVLGAALLAAGFLTLSFQPALSQHFSPKPVYDAYTELSEGRSEPLAAYQLPATAARYYTDAPIEEIDRRVELLAFLLDGGQRWAVVKADVFPGLNRAYRTTTGRHLFVADATSAHLLLIAAEPIEGRANESFIAEAVRSEATSPQYPVGARFDDKIELVGFDLELPGDDSVGASQRFGVTWQWRVIAAPPPGYEVFVHIDGHGQRLNGDHVPVGGRYPTNLWEAGDWISDSQDLSVPASFPPGDYTIYVGFFSGSKRLEVKSGPQDGANRVNAGTLRVR